MLMVGMLVPYTTYRRRTDRGYTKREPIEGATVPPAVVVYVSPSQIGELSTPTFCTLARELSSLVTSNRLR
ncbi:MAG TPA: hypothetical protein VKE51_37155 [Vicinamibacterales bacterium]|nr:hypothetical protein [Vicinamibacterales bacterium]